MMHCKRRGGEEPRAPGRADTGQRFTQSIGDRTRQPHAGWYLEARLAGPQGYGSTLVVQKRSKIDRRSPRAQHRDFLVLEDAQIVMRGAVRQELRWQMTNLLRHMIEETDPDRDHDTPGRKLTAVVEPDLETRCGTRHCHGRSVLKSRNRSLLEGKAILAERLERDRNTEVAIRQIAFRAEAAERVAACCIVQGRGETFGFEQHALGHVPDPELHRITNNAIFDAAGCELCGNRQSVRAGSNYCDIDHRWHETVPPISFMGKQGALADGRLLGCMVDDVVI